MLGLEAAGGHLIIEPVLPDGIARIELVGIPGVWGRRDAFGLARHAHRAADAFARQ
jgi:hypothetical protein